MCSVLASKGCHRSDFVAKFALESLAAVLLPFTSHPMQQKIPEILLDRWTFLLPFVWWHCPTGGRTRAGHTRNGVALQRITWKRTNSTHALWRFEVGEYHVILTQCLCGTFGALQQAARILGGTVELANEVKVGDPGPASEVMFLLAILVVYSEGCVLERICAFYNLRVPTCCTSLSRWLLRIPPELAHRRPRRYDMAA